MLRCTIAMPELPEVETIVRGLAPRLAGCRILAAEFRCPRVVRGDPPRIVGKTIHAVRRHGKYIVIDFADASASLGIHLGMTGKLLIDPELGAHSHAIITLDRGVLVHDDIRQVLLESIETGVSSVSDYLDSEGRRGSFQLRHRVYGKEGKPCPACSAPIRRILVAQRGTHFCPKCQKR